MSLKLLVIFSLPLLIDLFTCFLAIRRNHKGSGPSGLPGVTLVLYGLIILNLNAVNLFEKVYLFGGVAGVHFLLVFVIPTMDRHLVHRR